MALRRPYVRPTAGWWRRNPYFLVYMAREVTAFCVAAYALVLLAGLVALSRGEAAYQGWLAFLQSPFSLALHAVLLVGMLYHAWSWFEIMPKTLPPVRFAGRRLGARAITGLGLGAALAASTAVAAIVVGLAP